MGRQLAKPDCVIFHDAVDENSAPEDQDMLTQAALFITAFKRLKISYVTVPVRQLADIRDAIKQYQPRFAVNLVEMEAGKGKDAHRVPALLNRLQIPYTGCSAKALHDSNDKLLTKKILIKNKISTAELFSTPRKIKHHGKWIVKATTEHASFGMDDGCVLDQAQKVSAEIKRRTKKYRTRWFAEAFIGGREFNVGILAGPRAPEVLPIAEIDFSRLPKHKPQIVGYAAKWHEDSVEYRATPRRFVDPKREAALLQRLRRIALRCWRVFGLNGYARVDFRVDGRGRIYVLEINGNPGLSPDGGFIAAARKAGTLPVMVVQRIVRAARYS
jgi:D-alanine-D-alanine ligase